MINEGYWEGIMTHLDAEARVLVGSTAILGKGNDTDMLYMVKDLSVASEFLRRKGWDAEAEQYEKFDQCFMSFHAHPAEGVLNILITDSQDFFAGFARSVEVCKYLHKKGFTEVENRDVRVAIHQMVRDGYSMFVNEFGHVGVCPDV